MSTIVGNGPFLIGEYVPSERVVMVPNPNYYEQDEWGQQLPYLDEFVIEFVEDLETGLARFIAGETDAFGLRGKDYGALVDRQESDNFLIYNVGPASSTQFITFNQNPIEGEEDGGIEPPALTWLSNKSFRQAMAHLIDRQTIINNIAFGFGYPQYSFVWTVSPYYWEGAADAAFKYDPQRAKELLDAIGYTDRDGDGVREDPDGNKIELILNTNSGNDVREQIGELFSQEAQAIGVDVTFKPEAFNELVTRLVASYDWQMILIGLTGSVDPVGGANVYPSRGSLHMIEPNQESPRRDWEVGGGRRLGRGQPDHRRGAAHPRLPQAAGAVDRGGAVGVHLRAGVDGRRPQHDRQHQAAPAPRLRYEGSRRPAVHKVGRLTAGESGTAFPGSFRIPGLSSTA